MNEEAELAEWRRKQADQDADIADIIAHYERMKDAPYNSIGGRALYRRIHKHFPAMAARLKAAEEMREALGAVMSSLNASPEAQEHFSTSAMVAADAALAAYDAASRPISATSGGDSGRTEEADGASSGTHDKAKG